MVFALAVASLLGPAAHAVPYVESSRCGNCHRSFYAQWRRSQMGNSSLEQPYKDLLAVAVSNDASWDVGCARCHEPRAVSGNTVARTPLSNSEGVPCDYCHRVTGVEEHRGIYRPASLDTGSGPEATKHGPLEDAVSPFHQTEVVSLFSDPVFCAMCHQYTTERGVDSEQQFRQWRRTPFPDAGITCQNCHMPARPGKAASIPPMAPFRPETHEHGFRGGDSPSRLLGAVTLRFEVETPGEATIRITNAVAGHNIPGHAHGLRRLELVAEARDSRGNVLDEERWLYLRTFRSAGGRATAYFWQAASVAKDNTLASGETREETMELPSGTAKIVAYVEYHRFPDWMIARFGWSGRLTTPLTIARDSIEVR